MTRLIFLMLGTLVLGLLLWRLGPAEILRTTAQLGWHSLPILVCYGAYQAMRTGYVDETWAKEHHEYWYDEVKSGKSRQKYADDVPAETRSRSTPRGCRRHPPHRRTGACRPRQCRELENGRPPGR